MRAVTGPEVELRPSRQSVLPRESDRRDRGVRGASRVRVPPRVAAAPGATSTTQGIYLFGFATAALLLALLSTLGKPFFSVLLSLAVARMVFAGYYDVGGAHEWLKVAGGFGIALAALAMYGGTALGLEDARQRAVLALFRRGAADTACSGFEAQLDRLEAEAGVHQQL